MKRQLTAIIEREGFVALYPELDIASEGDTIEHARDNLQEALECSLNPLPKMKFGNVCARKST